MTRRYQSQPARQKRIPATPAAALPKLHVRNRHQGHYDFEHLVKKLPALAPYVIFTSAGAASIDFSNPAAVRALNRALLCAHYGIAHWDIPDGYLCPPIPGRADYLHGLADVLAQCNHGVIPRGPGITALDIGVGANAIYPLLGQAEYGWRFVGTDIDAKAIAVASTIVQSNPGLGSLIQLRQQPRHDQIFTEVIQAGECFDLSLCNPPFHASAAEAALGSQRKWRNLGKTNAARATPPLNFGGQSNELWCSGGEASFVRRMIQQSSECAARVFWFSSLISKADNLPAVHEQLRKVAAREVHEVAMAQGNKRSRFVAWTFLDAGQREQWRQARWVS
ncbi:MAG: 23S rRNA (adenine(1618)-N(6))-methyltransferase RlmF [Gammaproteobacteria bacterium HGW-Gammaproteobacteria-6]|nr:MAG: 23S rRNA (adenine(1618)-N(6))-methyltransferase RlmF [Gammaproteobacteria bacterium HGW-Gammaproteobacteria-6]